VTQLCQVLRVSTRTWRRWKRIEKEPVPELLPATYAAFEYLDFVELTLARHKPPLDASDLLVVDADRPPLTRPVVTIQLSHKSAR
jgi:hypothetical protein